MDNASLGVHKWRGRMIDGCGMLSAGSAPIETPRSSDLVDSSRSLAGSVPVESCRVCDAGFVVAATRPATIP